MTEKSQELNSEIDTDALASQLGQKVQKLLLGKSFITIRIALNGDLGAGKTTFTRYLLRSLGHTGKVKSPTYTLCEPYEIKLRLNEPIKTTEQKFDFHHFDLYRMNHPQEWVEAGFKEIMTNPGVCIVEWPEKAEDTLPPFDLIIYLATNDDETRNVRLIANTIIGQELIT